MRDKQVLFSSSLSALYYIYPPSWPLNNRFLGNLGYKNKSYFQILKSPVQSKYTPITLPPTSPLTQRDPQLGTCWYLPCRSFSLCHSSLPASGASRLRAWREKLKKSGKVFLLSWCSLSHWDPLSQQKTKAWLFRGVPMCGFLRGPSRTSALHSLLRKAKKAFFSWPSSTHHIASSQQEGLFSGVPVRWWGLVILPNI